MDIEKLDTSLQENMTEVQSIYSTLNSYAKEIVKRYTKPIDDLVKEIDANINNLTNEDIRRMELQLSILAYDLGELKDKTNTSAEIAELIQEQTEAEAFNTAVGNNEQRKNIALLTGAEKMYTAKLNKLVASQIKTKLDEAHRIVDTLKSILISRASDRKLTDNYEG